MATATLLEEYQSLEDLLEALGSIEPRRVRFKSTPGTATEADLIRINDRKQGIFELIDGVLVEKPMGLMESLLAGAIIAILRGFVVPRNLGIVTAPDGMMRLFPGTVRVPDVAFISWDRAPDRRVPMGAMSEFAPDLAVEVLSPSNTRAEMTRKRWDYFAAGVRLAWEVNPRSRNVAVYDAPERSTVLDASGILVSGDVLPGFALPLAELFGALDRRG